jgi:hypothetical protein
MTRETFVPKTFQATTLTVIEQANAIIAEYEAQGFTLSLRQLYYQFVSRDMIDNTVASYKRLGAIINNGRLRRRGLGNQASHNRTVGVDARRGL